jgi:hypothetical protein
MGKMQASLLVAVVVVLVIVVSVVVAEVVVLVGEVCWGKRWRLYLCAGGRSQAAMASATAPPTDCGRSSIYGRWYTSGDGYFLAA